MRSTTRLFAVLALTALAACGDDGGATPDATVDPIDAAEADAALIDAEVPDAEVPDAEAADASPPDAFPTDSELIGYARAAADGAGLSLPIQNATVTYLKPALGNDPAGFTIQVEQLGPALFIAVDPATLTPVPEVGDVVDFTITEMATSGTLRQAAAIADFARDSQGADVTALTQNLSGVTDLVLGLTSYESEVATTTVTIAADFAFAGSMFSQAQVDTPGIQADTNLRVRVPTTLIDTLDLATNCTFTITETPVGRFNTAVQLAVFAAGEVSGLDCDAPEVVSAVAISGTTVQVVFDRMIEPTSVLANGSQFTFDNGLVASAATASGRQVLVTTGLHLGGTTYTVTVANTVTDTLGAPLNDLADTAMFDGFVTPAQVRINEVNANIASGCDMIELRVVSAGSIAGFLLRERDSGSLVTFPAGFNVATDDVIVVHMNRPSATCNPGAATQETLAKDEQPLATFAGNYDNAFDFWSADTGLTATDNVFTLYNAASVIVDAVFVDDNEGTTAAAATEAQAADVATANQWQMVGGGVPAGGFVDADFIAHAVYDLNNTGTDAAGVTIQRLDNTDDNDRNDWTSANAAQTWGVLNAGQ